VDFLTACNFAEFKGWPYFEISALNEKGVNIIFEGLISEIY